MIMSEYIEYYADWLYILVAIVGSWFYSNASLVDTRLLYSRGILEVFNASYWTAVFACLSNILTRNSDFSILSGYIVR